MTFFNPLTQFINYGPQHPSVHGCLRLVLECQNENIVSITPHIGFLHRGIEKIIETKTYSQAIPYMDRTDYVSAGTQEHAYVLAVEKLLNIVPPKRAQFIRVLVCELSRISSHLIHLTMLALDSGSLSPFLLAMEEREKLMEIFEAISGARMLLNYFRVGGVASDIPNEVLKKISDWMTKFSVRLDDIESFLTNNNIFKSRTVGVGIITLNQALEFGLSGPNLRASGLKWDLRKNEPYENYADFDFEIPVMKIGDTYSRYLIKVFEMRQSLKIIQQCLDMPSGDICVQDLRFYPPQKTDDANIIYHTNYYRHGFVVPKGDARQTVESPKGEFAIHLFSDGTEKPYRCRIRSAGFSVLQLLSSIIKNVSELPVVLASLDLMPSEIDR